VRHRREGQLRKRATGVVPSAPRTGSLGWSTFAEARDPTRVKPRAILLAGNRHGQAVVRVMAVDADGQVDVSILPGSMAKNRHLLDRTVA